MVLEVVRGPFGARTSARVVFDQLGQKEGKQDGGAVSRDE